MIKIYTRDTTAEEGKLELKGELTVEGEIRSTTESYDESDIELQANDMERLTVEEMLGLYDGPNVFAVDTRNVDELRATEEIEEQKTRNSLRDGFDDTGSLNADEGFDPSIEKTDVLRLLDSHQDSYPIDVILDVVKSHWTESKYAKMEDRCETVPQVRRWIPLHDGGNLESLVKAIQSRLGDKNETEADDSPDENASAFLRMEELSKHEYEP